MKTLSVPSPLDIDCPVCPAGAGYTCGIRERNVGWRRPRENELAPMHWLRVESWNAQKSNLKAYEPRTDPNLAYR